MSGFGDLTDLERRPRGDFPAHSDRVGEVLPAWAAAALARDRYTRWLADHAIEWLTANHPGVSDE